MASTMKCNKCSERLKRLIAESDGSVQEVICDHIIDFDAPTDTSSNISILTRQQRKRKFLSSREFNNLADDKSKLRIAPIQKWRSLVVGDVYRIVKVHDKSVTIDGVDQIAHYAEFEAKNEQLINVWLTSIIYEDILLNDRGLTNIDLYRYVRELNVDNFRGVFMRDGLPNVSHHKECGIVNFNTSHEPGSHWVCYFRDDRRRIYFDSFGQRTLYEVQKYLKNKKEYEMGKSVIQRNTDIVQHTNTHVCGHLCLFVLTSLMREHLSFQDVLNKLNDGYTQNDW